MHDNDKGLGEFTVDLPGLILFSRIEIFKTVDSLFIEVHHLQNHDF